MRVAVCVYFVDIIMHDLDVACSYGRSSKIETKVSQTCVDLFLSLFFPCLNCLMCEEVSKLDLLWKIRDFWYIFYI